MKAKLLKKVRKKVKLYKRNNTYIVKKGSSEYCIYNYEKAILYYIWNVKWQAKNIFGCNPKKRIR